MKIKSSYVKPILHNIVCDDCNVIMEQTTNAVLATYPPKYSYICPNCGKKETSHTLFPYVTYEEESDKINFVKKNKTRQDRFLLQNPKAKLFDLSDFTGENRFCLSICPLDVDFSLPRERCTKSCIDCKKNYWFAEVDENDR